MSRWAPYALGLSLLSGCASAPPGPPPQPPLAPVPSGSTEASPQASRPSNTEALARIERALTAEDALTARLIAEQLVAEDPRDVRALYYAGVASEKLGMAREAERRYRQALSVDPSFPEAAINLGGMLIDSDRAPEALEVLRPAARASPGDLQLAENLGLAAVMTGDHATAVAAFARLERRGVLRLETRMTYADSLLSLGKKPEALKVLRDGLGQLTEDPEQLGTYANQMAGAGAFEEAITLVTRAIGKKPTAELHTRRALYRRSLRDLAGAKADLERALSLDPNLGAARLYLGELLEAEGQKAPARREYQLAVRAGGPPAKKAKEHLERLDAK